MTARKTLGRATTPAAATLDLRRRAADTRRRHQADARPVECVRRALGHHELLLSEPSAPPSKPPSAPGAQGRYQPPVVRSARRSRRSTGELTTAASVGKHEGCHRRKPLCREGQRDCSRSGDSFSSGQGAGNYEPVTTGNGKACARSLRRLAAAPGPAGCGWQRCRRSRAAARRLPEVISDRARAGRSSVARARSAASPATRTSSPSRSAATTSASRKVLRGLHRLA